VSDFDFENLSLHINLIKNYIKMAKEKEPKEKSTKKEPEKTLKEKRAAKAAKRDEKSKR
jgi:hypothetical protein